VIFIEASSRQSTVEDGGEDIRYPALIIGIAVTVAVLAACGGDEDEPEQQAINPDDFSTTIDNSFFPLTGVGQKVFEGEEVDPETGEIVPIRLESTVLPETDTVAGVEVLVLREDDFVDGELVETAFDYFAQHRDGSVYYFGERVDNFEDGELVDHEGSWLAGEGDNLPGVIMPGDPVPGQLFKQEQAPGVAEDEAKVVALDEAVTTPAGSFDGCLKTEDSNPLEEPVVIEFKFYCPGVGLVREEFPEGELNLVSH